MRGNRRWVLGIEQSWTSNALLPIAYCMLLSSCSLQGSKLQQYKVQGEELYIKHCSNCHQKDGKGLGLVYPPVDVSDYIDSNLAGVVCLMDYGIEGELTVNGKSFNKPMPGIPQLTDLEIAEITTYLYNSWGRSKGLIDVKEITEVLQQCK
jgi:mono/diheme cytochrome c family protein